MKISCLPSTHIHFVTLESVMSLFRSPKERSGASIAATGQVKVWEKNLGLRIALQKAVEIGNRLPTIDISTEFAVAQDDLVVSSAALKDTFPPLLNRMVSILEQQCDGTAHDESTSDTSVDSDDVQWERILSTQRVMRSKWEKVINKWHSRLHFGSEGHKSKMKTFNHTVWDQASISAQLKTSIISRFTHFS